MAEIGFDTKELKKDKPQVIFIELVDRRPSGFIKDGTRGTDWEEELDSPVAEFIPNFGYRRGVKEEMRDGKPHKVYFNEPIRYIKEQTVISVADQKKLGIEPHRASKEDKIIVERGKFSVVREGSFVGLYDYILDAFYNESNPNRSESAQAIYRVVDFDKEDEEINEMDFMIADATRLVQSLVQKIGEKQYKYQEEKINGLCQLFSIYAETPAGKVTGLMATAKRDPENFLKKATKFEQTKVIQITHALELSVIKFEGNTVMYANKDKVVATLGTGNISHAKKIEKLADLFGTPDFRAAYDEFQLELEVAQETASKQS